MAKRAKSHKGFTLLEVMVVIAISSILAASVSPAVSEAVHDRRQSMAAEEVVRFMRGAVGLTKRQGVAHMVQINTKAGAAKVGQMELWAGMNNRCKFNNWTAIAGSGPRAGILDFRGYNDSGVQISSTVNQVIYLRMPGPSWNYAIGIDSIHLCIQPNGDIFQWTPGTSNMTLLVGLVRLAVQRNAGAISEAGSNRELILSSNGTVRLRK